MGPYEGQLSHLLVSSLFKVVSHCSVPHKMSSQGPSSFDQQVEAHFRAMEPKQEAKAKVSSFDKQVQAHFAELQEAAKKREIPSAWDNIVAAQLHEALDLSRVEPSGVY